MNLHDDEMEFISLPDNLNELADLIETITDKKEYRIAAEKYNELAGKRVYAINLKTIKKNKPMAKPVKKVAPAKKAAKKEAPAKKAVAKKATKKVATKKATATSKDKKIGTSTTVDKKPIVGGMGREGSKKNEILTMYAAGKTIPEIIKATKYAENTVLGAVFHAIRTTPKGVRKNAKKK